MKGFLEELFFQSNKKNFNSKSVGNLDSEIEMNEKLLKMNLNEKQKKLLLRIEDAKDLIAEEISFESYIAGFKIGLKIDLVKILCYN